MRTSSLFTAEVERDSIRDASAFRVEIEPEREAVRVCPVGELDLGTVEPVRAAIEELMDAGFECVLLDLRRTTFLDSTGLRLAVDMQVRSSHDGWRFGLLEGPPAVQRAFDISGLHSVLPFVSPSELRRRPWR
jgi:anti-sigma B factor antagonist